MLLSRFKESKYSTLILASIFAFTLFLQCCFFHYQAFHSILISSLWNDPISFFTFYAPKISISLFIASFVFLFKRKSWTIYVSLLVSIWCIAELVYYRVYESFLDPYSILIVDNMNGFWDSVIPLIYSSDYVFVLISIIYLVIYLIFKNPQKDIKAFTILILSAILMQILTGELLYKKHLPYLRQESFLKSDDFKPVDKAYYPFSNDFIRVISGGELWTLQYHDWYIRNTSSIHHFILNVIDIVEISCFENSDSTTDIVISDDVESLINNTKNIEHINKGTQNRLIIILVESLENWVISESITPNLYHSLKCNSNLLYASKITKQTLKGNSADGQLIVMTGLLPVQEGVVCYKYFQNTFPSLSKLYDSSTAIIPGSLGAWNQRAMSKAYGIDSSFVVLENDRIVIDNTINQYSQSKFLLSLTISTHLPCTAFTDSATIKCNYNPKAVSDYINSMNFLDTHLGKLFNNLHSDSILQNSTIVITGDHTIFPSEMRKEFSDYCKTNNLDYKVEENYCPLIIYSPNIKEKTIVDEEAYQMDIYPTILHVIGAKDYYWKGFGVNLLDSVARQNRPISPENAFELSDKLIRANYFKEIEDSLYSQNQK